MFDNNLNYLYFQHSIAIIFNRIFLLTIKIICLPTIIYAYLYDLSKYSCLTIIILFYRIIISIIIIIISRHRLLVGFHWSLSASLLMSPRHFWIFLLISTMLWSRCSWFFLWLSVNPAFSHAFGDRSKCTNYNWYHISHIPHIFSSQTRPKYFSIHFL